jgi:hypothetical protein
MMNQHFDVQIPWWIEEGTRVSLIVHAFRPVTYKNVARLRVMDSDAFSHFGKG